MKFSIMDFSSKCDQIRRYLKYPITVYVRLSWLNGRVQMFNLCIKSQRQRSAWSITKRQIFMQNATNTYGDKLMLNVAILASLSFSMK